MTIKIYRAGGPIPQSIQFRGEEFKSGFELDFRDLNAIAFEALDKKKYESAYDFMKSAYKLNKSGKKLKTIERIQKCKKQEK